LVDERQSDGSDRHNGTDVADVNGWDRELNGIARAWSGRPTRQHSAEPVPASQRLPAHQVSDDDPLPWRPPALADNTPSTGTPVTEPPLWREAARHASTSPAAPVAPLDWTPPADPPAWTPATERPAPVDPLAPAPADPLAAAPGDPLAAAPADPLAADLSPVASGAGPTSGELPQRVPAEPDVPHVPEAADVGGLTPPAGAPQLARIADQLRRDDVPSEECRTKGFDVDAVLDAVKGVAGVRAAGLRTNPRGAHTLRLDLHDDADPVQVSRVVAQLLQERMGLSAAPNDVPRPRTSPEQPAAHPTPAARPAAPTEPAASIRPASSSHPEASTSSAAPDPSLIGSAAGVPAPDRRAFDGEQTRYAPQPALSPASGSGNRIVIDQVQVHVNGLEASVEVRLAAAGRTALGLAKGPAIDSYVLRLAAVSAAKAVDDLIRQTGRPALPESRAASRCFVEHTAVVPFGATDVAVVVVLLVCGGWVEQLAGSAVVDGDSRYAAVRATLGAVHQKLDALLSD
jgi:hypothetical protein